jgi:hypothetical protein
MAGRRPELIGKLALRIKIATPRYLLPGAVDRQVHGYSFSRIEEDYPLVSELTR